MKKSLGLVLALASAAALAQSPERGRSIYEEKCTACHSLDANRVGPMHRGVIGRKAGSVPDYTYSAALRRSALVWTPEKIREWLADPERLIPGQQMGYRLEQEADRADVAAYLATQSQR
jgi:cytochrome c